VASLRDQIAQEAAAAGRAAPALRDDLVAEALRAAAALVRERRGPILEANAADRDAAAGRLDEGTLDRLRLDDARIDALASQVEAMAEIEPLERDAGSWTLPNGLHVSERRIPIGIVGANFEARPNVALDVAGQLLKSLNTAVLRTGGAALATVTVLVDDVLRPALEAAGLPSAAVGLVRSPDREGARVLVSLPREIPLVILRGSGETTAALARLAAEHGVRTLAHAEGGGVLYVHGSASPERALALVDASLDRLGVCNRLNLLLVDREAVGLVPSVLELLDGKGLEVRGTVEGALPLDRPLGYEWANDADRVETVTVALVDGLEEAVRVANGETSGLAAGIVAEDEEAAERFLDAYRGTCGVLARDDAVRGRVRAHRRPGDRDQRRLGSGAARAGHLSRPLAPPVPHRRRHDSTGMTVAVKLGTSLVAGRGGSVRRSVLRARAREIGAVVRSGEPVAVVSSGAIALGLPYLGVDRRPRSVPKLQAASALGQARLQRAWEQALRPEGLLAAQVLLTAEDVAD
jgi:glutamate-5-semialdehyde dehydrogenase